MNENNGIYKVLCQIQCEDEIGSGIQVAPDLILTVDHVVALGKNTQATITAKFEDNHDPIECTIIKNTTPLMLLKMEKEHEFKTWSIGEDSMNEGTLVKACGFFPSNSNKADKIDMSCVRILENVEDDPHNVILKPSEERRNSFKGFSGAPIISEGCIIGILLAQQSINGTANRLYGLYGLHFRERLGKLGVSLPISRRTSIGLDIDNKPNITLVATDPLHLLDIDNMLDELFEPIRNERENGEILKSQEEIREFLKRLPERNSSDEKKAEFFYIGAIWMLLDHHMEEANQYFCEAQKYNPGLDDSVYCAYSLIAKGKSEEAKARLLPVNSTQKLNAYLSCLVVTKESSTIAKAVVDSHSLSLDKQSYRLLALLALQSDCYIDGHEYIRLAIKQNTSDVELLILDALLYYWSAMHTIYPDIERTNFSFVSGFYFYPTVQQQQDLISSYTILEKLYNSESLINNDGTRAMIAWALVAVSSALPGKDRELWLSNFRKLSYLHPADIIYCVHNKINIPAGMCEEFLALDVTNDKTGMSAFATLQLYILQEKYEQAKEFFMTNKGLISAYLKMSVGECEFNLLVDCKELSAAKKLLKKLNLSKDEKERLEICVENAGNPKSFNVLVKKAVLLAQRTKLPLDFRNAITVCRKYNKWNEAIKLSKEHWRISGELSALEFMAEAHYQKREYSKCLKVISQAESAGDISTNLRHYKVNSLLRLAHFEEAREVANALGNFEVNPQLVILQARTYISEGQPQKAIQVLRAYADQDLYDLEIYQLLIELIQGDDPDRAYQYALSLHKKYPNNEEITKYAGMIAIHTGHDDSELAYCFTSALQKEAQKGESVKIYNIEDILRIMEEQKKHNEKLDKMYKNVECPIHMIAIPDTNTLGGLIFNILEGGLPYYGCFGARKDVAINYNLPLLLDYTTCLIMYKLNILDEICDVFKTVWLDSHIFEIWINDFNKLKNVQTSIAERDIKLNEMLEKLSFSQYSISWPIPDDIECSPYDYMVLRCAQDNNALIIEENPTSELKGTSTPDEWYERNIKPCDFYAALSGLYLPHPEYNPNEINTLNVEKIVPHCKLILDNQVLFELLEADALNDVFSVFSVYLTDHQVNIISSNAQKQNDRIKNVHLLEKSCEYVADLYRNGKIQLHPDVSKMDELENPYVQLLHNEFNIACETPVTLVIDDRFASVYQRIGSGKKQSNIHTTFDLIAALYQDQKIDSVKYYNLLDNMMSMGYSFIVPPPDYLYNRLLLAECTADGYLHEYDKISNIRRSVAYALDNDSGVRIDKVRATNMSEFVGYILELNQTFNQVLISIWSSEKSIEWCKGVSDWLLTHIGVFLCDVSLSGNTTFETLADQQMMLLANVIRVPNSKEHYIKWIEPYLLASWCANPGLINKVVQSTLNMFDNIECKDSDYTEATKKMAESLMLRYIKMMPDMLFEELIKTNRFSADKTIVKQSSLSLLDLPDFPDLSACVSKTSRIDKDAILLGDHEAFQAATEFIISDNSKNSDIFIKEFPFDSVGAVESSVNGILAQYFAELSYFFPINQRAHLHELKRRLSVIRYQ